jgi:molybdate transport system permease protein
MDWQASSVSFVLALACVLVLLPVGCWLGHWLAYSTSRLKPLIEILVLVPLVIPPTVLGFYFLSAFGQQSALGRWLAGHNIQLVFSFKGLLLASCVANVPFMVQPIQRAFAAVNRDLREAAWVNGLGYWHTFRRLELPLALPGLVSGCALTFAHTLGEFGVVLMVGGAIPGETKTLSVTVYDRVQSFDMASAHANAALLLGMAVAMLALAFLAERFYSKRFSSQRG